MTEVKVFDNLPVSSDLGKLSQIFEASVSLDKAPLSESNSEKDQGIITSDSSTKGNVREILSKVQASLKRRISDGKREGNDEGEMILESKDEIAKRV